MVFCQNCGQKNSLQSNFCRFCGKKFIQKNQQQEQHQRQPESNRRSEVNRQPDARKPYSWQTDEFEYKNPSARPTQQIDNVQPLTNQTQQNVPQPAYQNRQMIKPQHQNTLSNGYRCRFCNTNQMPVIERKVSPTGWAVFTVLLITTLLFFWIGLLIQEDRQICPVCRLRVN